MSEVQLAAAHAAQFQFIALFPIECKDTRPQVSVGNTGSLTG